MVPIDTEPQPIMQAYIDLKLQTLAAARMLSPSGPVGQTHWGDSTARNPAPATHSTDAQLKQDLAAIFKKIGDKQTCTIALYELYRITQLYTKVNIFAQLQNASEAFRAYIGDGLAQMEKTAAAGRTPSCVPMSTPPSAALNLSFPKFGPLSPVNTNSLSDVKSMNTKLEPTNFSLPPSYAEDDRTRNPVLSRGGPMPDQSKAATWGSKKRQIIIWRVTAVTSGALYAIRERMKSIQLAAAAGIQDSANEPLIPVNGNLSHGLPNQFPLATEHASFENSMQGGVLPMDEKALSGLQARMERLKSGTIEPL